MSTFWYEILTSPVFWGALVIWVVIDIAAQSYGNSLMTNLNRLLGKPSIFDMDDKPEDTVTLYVHADKAANTFRNAMHHPLDSLIGFIRKGIDYLVGNLKEDNKPFVLLGYGLAFILLVIYLYLDAISVIIILINQGLVSQFNIPEFLQRFEYVAIGGSLFALLVGFYTLSQITQTPSSLSGWDKRRGSWKSIAKALTYILILLGFFSVIFLALDLMVDLGYFTTQGSIINGLVDFSSVWLTRINAALSSILLFEDGLMGVVLLACIALGLFWVVFVVVQVILRIAGNVLPIVINLAHRILVGVILIAWFLITTPILLLVTLFQGISKD